VKWHGGRNAAQGISGEWEPCSGFTYITYLSDFPGIFQMGRAVWAHEYSQPVHVVARLKIDEVRDWDDRRVRNRVASCELVVDGQPSLSVLPGTPCASCAQAKRIAAAVLGNEDWVRRGLQRFYDAPSKTLIMVEQDGRGVAALFVMRADWMLAPGRYDARTAQGRFLVNRSSSSVEWQHTPGSSL
jgi:hypothetical protein